MENIMSLEEAKSLFNTKVFECEMSNKTLVEMIKNGSSEDLINDVRKSITETQNEIVRLGNYIKDFSNDEKPLYDGIKKKTRAEARADIARENQCSMSLYDSIKKSDATPNTDSVADSVIKCNHFIVNFNGGLNVEPWFVDSVDFFDKHMMSVSIINHMAERNGRKYPIISELLSAQNTFNMSIDYLDDNGDVIYTEHYHQCKIDLSTSYSRTSLNYSNDGYDKILINISYSFVTYETAH